MHLGIIIDEERIRHEQSMLGRLSIGLMAEGVQVSRIVPNTSAGELLDQAEQRVALAARIETPMRVLPWMRQARVNRIAESFGKAFPDVLYAVGEESWPLAIDLAQAIERPVLIDVCSMIHVKSAPLPARQSHIAGYIVPSEPIAVALRRRVGEAVHTVPLGIASLNQPAAVTLDRTSIIAIAIIGSASDVHAYSAMLEGICAVAPEIESLQIFLELQGQYEHEIWRRAEHLNLLPHVSAIEDVSTYRTLLTHCDLLMMPERRGELRSLMIEAMALGLPVIAADDPAVDLLVDGKTAYVVRKSYGSEWASRIRDVLLNPDAARQVGLQARQTVLVTNRSSEQVSKLIEVVENTARSPHLRLSPLAR